MPDEPEEEQPDDCDGCHEPVDYLRLFVGWSGRREWLCDACYLIACDEE